MENENGRLTPLTPSAAELRQEYLALHDRMLVVQRELEKSRSISAEAIIENVLATRIADVRDRTNRANADYQAAARILLNAWTKSGIEKLGISQIMNLLAGTGVDRMLGTSEKNRIEYRRIIGELLGHNGLGFTSHRRGRNGNDRYYSITEPLPDRLMDPTNPLVEKSDGSSTDF
ncbi:MAG TPA: hypothetical protein VFE47_15605 [Tepidisphaeraceae bacterium]|jgi:hypothetical protein|nr:hypothetical protein [Tepidisphaeraceae bacterium]